MMSMVERVARRLYKEAGYIGWRGLREPFRESYLRQARAAIEAMRDPTDVMVDAVNGSDLDIYWCYRADGRPSEPADVFHIMIDAALNEQVAG